MATEAERTPAGAPGDASLRPVVAGPRPVSPDVHPRHDGHGGRHRSGGSHGRTSPTGSRAVGGRLDGLDAARGLAVLSMLVAHLSPVGGVLDLSEYLTAPLFAVVIGAAMGLSLTRPHVSSRRFLVDNLARGLVLVALGLLLQPLYGQIDVVLAYLGVLVIVLAPVAVLLRPVPVLTVGVLVALAVLGPLLVERVRESLALSGAAPSWLVDHLLLWTVTGPSYRLVSFLPMALAGLVLALLLPRLTSLGLSATVAVVLVGTFGVIHVLGARSPEGAAPYSGTTAEVVAACFLAAGAVAASFAVVDLADRLPPLRPVLSPVLASGRLALTAYAVQILVLAVIALARDGARDDTWPVLLGTTVVVVGTCWLLDRFLGTGPLEILVRAARLPVRGRHGGALSGRRPPRGHGSPTRSTPPGA